MAGIETYGGCCPICLKSLFQKWEDSGEGLIFEACSWCGFVYVYDNEENEFTEEDRVSFWKMLSQVYGVTDREEMSRKVAVTEYTPSDNKEFFPSIFSHVSEVDAHPIYKMLWRIRTTANKDGFSMEGIHVYRKEDPEAKGILLGYAEGKVEIDWKGTDGERIVQEIDAIEIGKTISISSEPSLKNMLNQVETPY